MCILIIILQNHNKPKIPVYMVIFDTQLLHYTPIKSRFQVLNIKNFVINHSFFNTYNQFLNYYIKILNKTAFLK